MTKVRATEWNADSTQTKYIQESDGKLTVNNSQNLDPLLKRNKELVEENEKLKSQVGDWKNSLWGSHYRQRFHT